MNDDYVDLDEAIIRWRLKDRGDTAYSLSQYLGVSEAQVSRILTGNRRCDLRTANRIALFVEMPAQFFVQTVRQAVA